MGHGGVHAGSGQIHGGVARGVREGARDVRVARGRQSVGIWAMGVL